MKHARPNDAENGKLKLYSLELEEAFAAIVRELVELAGLDGLVEVVVGPAGNSLKNLVEGGKLGQGGVDLVFMDHVEALYEEELKRMEELDIFRSGSTVVADNVLRPGAPAYKAFMERNGKWNSEVVKTLIVPGDFEVS